MFFKRKNEEDTPLLDSTEGDVIKRRPQTNVIVQIRIRPDQITQFENDLEELCNQYINMKDDDEVAPPPGGQGRINQAGFPG